MTGARDLDDEHRRWARLKASIDAGVRHGEIEALLARINDEPDSAVADGARVTWSKRDSSAPVISMD